MATGVFSAIAKYLQSPTVFMDPNDPRSHSSESHNGPAAEVDRAHAEQGSSQFQTPGTVNNMSAVLKIVLVLAAFAQNVIAFSPATRLAAKRTFLAASRTGHLSYGKKALQMPPPPRRTEHSILPR